MASQPKLANQTRGAPRRWAKSAAAGGTSPNTRTGSPWASNQVASASICPGSRCSKRSRASRVASGSAPRASACTTPTSHWQGRCSNGTGPRAMVKKSGGRALEITRRQWGSSWCKAAKTAAEREPWPKPWALMQATISTATAGGRPTGHLQAPRTAALRRASHRPGRTNGG